MKVTFEHTATPRKKKGEPVDETLVWDNVVRVGLVIVQADGTERHYKYVRSVTIERTPSEGRPLP